MDRYCNGDNFMFEPAIFQSPRAQRFGRPETQEVYTHFAEPSQSGHSTQNPDLGVNE
jgi:hypothetical protein